MGACWLHLAACSEPPSRTTTTGDAVRVKRRAVEKRIEEVQGDGMAAAEGSTSASGSLRTLENLQFDNLALQRLPVDSEKRTYPRPVSGTALEFRGSSTVKLLLRDPTCSSNTVVCWCRSMFLPCSAHSCEESSARLSHKECTRAPRLSGRH